MNSTDNPKNTSTEINSPIRFRFIVHSFYFLISFTYCFLYYWKVVKYADFSAKSGIAAVLSFSTWKPFQFRLLFPIIYKAVSVFGFLPPKAIFLGLSIVIVYFIIVVYKFILDEYFENKNVNIVLAVTILYPMTWNYVLLNQAYLFYDYMSILVYVIGMYFILKEKFWPLVLVLTLGLFNKETAAFLIFAYVFYNYKIIFTKKIIVNTLILVVIFFIVKGILYLIFINNPGSSVEICVYENYKILSNLLKERVLFKNFILCFGGMYVFAILLFLTGRWKSFVSVSGGGKLYINLVFIPYMIMGIYVVYFTEVRVYTELIPMLTTLFLIFVSTVENIGIKPIEKGTGK